MRRRLFKTDVLTYRSTAGVDKDNNYKGFYERHYLIEMKINVLPYPLGFVFRPGFARLTGIKNLQPTFELLRHATTLSVLQECQLAVLCLILILIICV